MTDSVLHGINASVLSILPASEGLLCTSSYKDLVLQLVSEEMSKTDDTRLIGLEQQIKAADLECGNWKLHVDPDKNLLLALTFPSIYAEALALVTDRGVRFEFWGHTPEPDLLKQYLSGESPEIPIFTRVASSARITKTVDEFDDVNVILRCNKILQSMGQRINLDTFELGAIEAGSNARVSSPLAESSHHDPLDTSQVFVDLYHWFCSCDDFDAEMTAFSFSSGEILRNNSTCQVLHSFLRHSQCKHPEKLAVCKHILATVIVVLNWKACERLELCDFC